MNRELFIADVTRLSRKYKRELFLNALADYVKENYFSKDLMSKSFEPNVHKDKVIELVCSYYERSLEEMVNGGRQVKIVKTKMVLGYLLWRRTSLTQMDIAKLLRYADHTCVIHLRESISREMEVNESLREEVEYLNGQL